MTVTAHYIDPNQKLQILCQKDIYSQKDILGVNITEKLKGVGEGWGINHNVITVSHDQGSNMVAAMHVIVIGKAFLALPIDYNCAVL